MIDELKPYPTYRDSGVSWLGQVPEHWELRSLGSITSTISHHGRPDLPLLSVVREKGVIPRSTMSDEENHNFVPDDLSDYKIVREGNLVVNKMKAWQGSLGIAPMDGIVSPAYFVFDIRIGDRQFAQTLLRSKVYIPFFAQASDGVRIGQWELSVVGMKRIPVVVPPTLEQAGIVRYLDHADWRVQHAIRARQQLIKLLMEQKQAIIQGAVTRGLDMLACLRSLGSAPDYRVNARWPIVRMSQICHIRCETGAPDLDLLSVFLDSGVIPYGKGRGQVHKPSLDLTRYQIVHCGDLVLNNQQAWRGSVGVSQYYGIISPAYVVMCLDESLDPHFADYLFRSDLMVDQYVTSSKGVGDIQRDVYIPWLKNARVPVPLIEEQRAILTKLDHELASINRELSACRDEIDLLREYRTRLIADVVTGKLDVRDAAAYLPDEPEEQPEPLDEEPADDAPDLESEEEGDGDLSEVESRDV